VNGGRGSWLFGIPGAVSPACLDQLMCLILNKLAELKSCMIEYAKNLPPRKFDLYDMPT